MSEYTEGTRKGYIDGWNGDTSKNEDRTYLYRLGYNDGRECGELEHLTYLKVYPRNHRI